MSDRLLKESDVMKIAFQFPYMVNSAFFDAVKALPSAPIIDICFCRECKWEWTQKCPPHRMGLIHDESDYCSYGIRKGADDD